MKIKLYSAIQRGEYHTNYCEDFLVTGQIDNRIQVCAVLDGCTNGTESFFASALAGKLLRKIIKEHDYKDLYNKSPLTNEDYLKSITCDLFAELNLVKNQLMLERNELLTTLIIAIIDKTDKSGVVLVVGDGVVCIDKHITEFDQENKPDYIGYHLNENFEKWYAKQTQKICFENFHDFSIATDGVAMFQQVEKVPKTNSIDPMDFLLKDNAHSDKDNLLEFKIKEIETKYGYKSMDDVAIIRVITD